ncbi:hypothetical protein COY17_03105 [Candidatus Saccharibacteria bacterium CG_4_10_14_0_2_um_filter_52_9]|nr:MAG: hypothetical protein COY17_03105 [Candidatus Saccharibacteria bacterium CG_4_10_14_0_2_um_filter_52_9]
MKIKKLAANTGFTIVELMIALMVLSTILLMGTVILIQIGALYTKGVNGASLQNATRNALVDVSSSLQFSGDDLSMAPDLHVAGTLINAFCIGSTRYSYVLNRELGTTDTTGTPAPHVLWRDTLPNVGTCTALDISNDSVNMATQGYEMIPEHIRLTKLAITQSPTDSDVYQIDVNMAYGDSDLFTDASSTTCKGGPGTQFCGTSQLSNSVNRRIK